MRYKVYAVEKITYCLTVEAKSRMHALARAVDVDTFLYVDGWRAVNKVNEDFTVEDVK